MIRDPEAMPRIPTADADGKFVATPMETGAAPRRHGRAGRARGAARLAPRAHPARRRPHACCPASPPTHPEDRITMWMGHRPGLPDSLPVIGPSRATPDVIYAFGHGHIGMTSAPMTGRDRRRPRRRPPRPDRHLPVCRRPVRLSARQPRKLAAGGLFDLGDQALREALDLGVGQRALLRLQHDGDGERFLAFGQPLALVDVEQADLGDELAVDAAGGAQQLLGRHVAVDDEGEVALDRLEHRQIQRRPWLRARTRLRHRVEEHLEAGDRRPRHRAPRAPPGAPRRKRRALWARAAGAGAARVVPGGRLGRDLDDFGRRAHRCECGQRIGLDIVEIDLARRSRPVARAGLPAAHPGGRQRLAVRRIVAI